MNNTRILIFIIAFLPLLAPANTNLNVELGQASNSYNKIKINGETGTLFNLRPALDPTLYYRLSLVHKFDSPHGIRFLYAPLKFSGDHRFSKDITFNGVNFPAGKETEAEFKFNSYRGTYFYEVVAKESLFLRVGGTLKVRDAKIELAQDDRKKAKKNTGLVPLLYIFSEYKWANAFRIAFDFDGLMAPQGRAFDLALMTGYYISPSSHINVGYRMLEGGADNDEVYTFSQINYFFTSLQIAF